MKCSLISGDRAEIVDACGAAMQRMILEGRSPDDLTEEEIARELYTHNLPELDLQVRTSGELGISNFLLWQSPLRCNPRDRNALARFPPRAGASAGIERYRTAGSRERVKKSGALARP
jgi:hypothetical protein